MADEIEVVDYDTNWPRLFDEERALLAGALPPDQVLAIEHAGSTAIPGIAAKPIIDIFLAVRSIVAAWATLIEPIEAISPEPGQTAHVLRQGHAALPRTANASCSHYGVV